ncbi:hypothetical protein MRX96_037600 [Rhipicephalus microplus]
MAASTWVDPAGIERRRPAAANCIASLTSFSRPPPRASLLTLPFFFCSLLPSFSSSKERARRFADASRPPSFPSASRGRPECAVTSWRRGSTLVVNVVCYGSGRREWTRGRQRRWAPRRTRERDVVLETYERVRRF